MLTTPFNTSPPPLTLGKAPPSNHAPSRILFLFSQAEPLRRAQHALLPEIFRLHAALTNRYGHKFDACAQWEADADWATLDALNNEMDRLDDQFTEAVDELLAIEATTLDELVAKLRVCRWEQPTQTARLDHNELIIINTLAELERFVGGAA